ncbi:putative ectomycorrhiza-upregulated zf-mynd domain-containing protein [Hirsutella rhossiliensis]
MHSNSGQVEAVIVRCEAEKRKFPLWSATAIPANHDVFSQSVPSVPALIEVPLVLYRTGTQSANEADLDNQIATYLNIDADSGFAPPEWQSQVGTVVVARKDRRPFYPQHLEGVWMFCDHILDLFGEGDGPPRWLYSRHAFEEWWVNYCKEQKRIRPGKGGERDPDDWGAVRSPYEV